MRVRLLQTRLLHGVGLDLSVAGPSRPINCEEEGKEGGNPDDVRMAFEGLPPIAMQGGQIARESQKPADLHRQKRKQKSTTLKNILAEGAIALPVTLSGGALFAS